MLDILKKFLIKSPQTFHKFAELPSAIQQYAVTFLEKNDFKNGHVNLSNTNRAFHAFFATQRHDLNNDYLVLSHALTRHVERAEYARNRRIDILGLLTMIALLAPPVVGDIAGRDNNLFHATIAAAVLLLVILPIMSRYVANRDYEQIGNIPRRAELIDARKGHITDIPFGSIKNNDLSLYRMVRKFFEERGHKVFDNEWTGDVIKRLSMLDTINQVHNELLLRVPK